MQQQPVSVQNRKPSEISFQSLQVGIILFKTRGIVYNCCARSVLFCASEAMAATEADTTRMKQTDNAMTRSMCNVKLGQRSETKILLEKLDLASIVMKWSRLRYYGHLQRIKEDLWPHLA